MNHKRMVTNAGIELTFAVNHLGYFLTTNLLLDILKENNSSRIVVVASDAHFNGTINMSDLMHQHAYHPFAVYSDTKLANILFTYKLASKLMGTGVTANTLHPGVIKTKFGVTDRDSNSTFRMGIISPEAGAETQIYLSISDEVEGVSGKYFTNKQIDRSSQESYDMRLASDLWDRSLDLTGLASL